MALKLLGWDSQTDLLVDLNAAFDTPFYVEEVRLRLQRHADALLDRHARRGDSGKHLRKAVERDADLLACCVALAMRAALHAQEEQRATSTADLKRLVEQLTSSNRNAVRLCTVHKGKGLEAERVVIVHPEDLALASGDAEEERRVCFVVYTRLDPREESPRRRNVIPPPGGVLEWVW